MAFPVLPAPISATFLSRGEEAQVSTGKAGDKGRAPHRSAEPGHRVAGLLGATIMFLTPSCFGHLVLRRPEPSLIGPNEASILIFWRVGKVPELVNIRGERPQIIQSNSQCSQEEKLRLQMGKCPAIGQPGKEWQRWEALKHLPSGQC